MPIEFPCRHCNTSLRVGDAAAGKQAKCPHCGEVSQVPGIDPSTPPAAATPPNDPPSQPMLPSVPVGASFDAENPYAAPGYHPSDRSMAATGMFQPTVMDLGKVISQGWRIYSEQFVLCLGAVLVYAVISGSAGIGKLLIDQAAEFADPNFGTFIQLFTLIGKSIFDAWLGAGLIIFLLNIVMKRTATVGQLFSG